MCHSGVNTFGSWAVLWDLYCAEMTLLWSMLTFVEIFNDHKASQLVQGLKHLMVMMLLMMMPMMMM